MALKHVHKEPKLVIKITGQPNDIYACLDRLKMFYDDKCLIVFTLRKDISSNKYHLFINVFQEPV